MLGPENLFTKSKWLKRCRLWRLIFLMHPDGYWDPSDSIALPLLAQKVRRQDVAHLVKGKRKLWRNLMVIGATGGELEQAGESFHGHADTAEGKLCPLTGLEPEALEWSMPERLRAIAAYYEDSDKPLPAARIWVRTHRRRGGLLFVARA